MTRQLKGDLSNVQWANRLGKPILIRTGKTVRGGFLTSIGINFVIVDRNHVDRADIVSVRDL